MAIELSDLIPAYAYLRMSDPRQDTSIEQQREQIIRWATGKYRIVRWYIDEGLSGSKDVEKREEFNRMIDDAEKLGEVDAIVCLNNSRFGRLHTFEFAPYKRRLWEAGIYLDTVLDGLTDWDSDTGQIVDVVHTVKNRGVSLTIGQTSLNGRINSTKKGKPSGRTPYGLHKVATDEQGNQHTIKRGEIFRTPKSWTYTYVPGDDTEVKIVRWLFTEYAKPETSMRELARRLNQQNIPSPGGKKWCDRTIRVMLDNRAYVGDAQFGKSACKGSFYISNKGETQRVKGGKLKRGIKRRPLELQTITPDSFEGIIPRPLFDKVQEKLSRNACQPHKHSDYPLTGLLKCGHCGGTFVAKPKKGCVRYICKSANQVPGGGCSCWSVTQRQFLPFVLQKLRQGIDEHLIGTMEAKLPDEPSHDTKAIERQLAKLEKEYSKGLERLPLIDAEILPDFQARLKELSKQRDELRQQLQQETFDSGEWAKQWFDWWDGVRDSLIWVDTAEPLPDAPDTFTGDATEGTIPVAPSTLRETLKAMGFRVELFFRPYDGPNKSRKWVLDHGRINVSLNGFTMRTTGATGSHSEPLAPLSLVIPFQGSEYRRAG